MATYSQPWYRLLIVAVNRANCIFQIWKDQQVTKRQLVAHE